MVDTAATCRAGSLSMFSFGSQSLAACALCVCSRAFPLFRVPIVVHTNQITMETYDMAITRSSVFNLKDRKAL